MQDTRKWGRPPWRTELECPAAPLPAETGVAIVGAGLTGLSAAYHLRRARPDRPVTVLEAATVGDGASGRSGGLMLEDTAAGPLSGFEHCLDAAAELVARERIECGLVLNGCWEISHRRSAADSPVRWDDGGVPLRVFQVVPGGVVDPARLVAGLARAALGAGASIHERCSVVDLDCGPPLRLDTSAGPLTAGHVVLATDAFSLALSEMRSMAEAMLAVAVATEPLEETAIRQLGLRSRLPFYTEDLPYLWGRLTSENALVLGSGLLHPEAGDIAKVSLDSTAARRLFSGLERRIRRLHPALSAIRFTHRWAGPISITRDHRPILREHSRSPRVLVTGGYSGHGLAQAIRMGRLAAERIAASR